MNLNPCLQLETNRSNSKTLTRPSSNEYSRRFSSSIGTKNMRIVPWTAVAFELLTLNLQFDRNEYIFRVYIFQMNEEKNGILRI